MALNVPSSGEPITDKVVVPTWYRFFADLNRLAAGKLDASDVSTFMLTVLDDTTAAAALTTLGITYGTFTPILSTTTNLDSSTAAVTQYIRVGNMVVVFGNFAADPTTSGVATVMLMTLPVASNFAANAELGGGAWNGASTGYARFIGDTTNDRVVANWVPTHSNNLTYGFIFGYQVI